jgi:hypothetical protein
MQPLDWQQLWQSPPSAPAPPAPAPSASVASDWGGLRPARLSLRQYRGPKPEQVFKQLFGREPDTDESTGQWVYTQS